MAKIVDQPSLDDLRKSAEKIKTLSEQLKDELERRNGMIVWLVDDGFTQGTVARAAGLKPGSLTGILSNPKPGKLF
jgi:predicted phosphoribosyltransferase